MAKEIRDGLRLHTGRTLDEQIKLYEIEIKAINDFVTSTEKIYPDYPTLPETRGTIRHYKKIVKWLKELKAYKEEQS